MDPVAAPAGVGNEVICYGAVDALQHIGAHVNDAPVNHTEGARGSGAEIENAAAIEWAAIIDCYDDAAAGLRVCDANTRPERQSLVGRGEPGAVTRIVRRHPEECVRRGLPRLRMHWYSRNGRRQKDNCPTIHNRNPSI